MRMASATDGAETVKDVITGVPVQPTGGALFVGVGDGAPGGAGAGAGVFVGVADGAADELVAVGEGLFNAADEAVAVGEGLFSATEGLTWMETAAASLETPAAL